jgi:hypothetical protein
MRAFVIGFAALAFGVTLSACSGEKSGALAPVKTDPAAVEKLVASLAAESFKGKATAAADVASVRDALPKEIALTWGSLNFDQASGATVLTAAKLTPAGMPNVGLSVDEIRLWDFDAEFAKARLAGQRLTETASLARRIELKGAKIFGIETLIGPAMDAYAGVIDDAVAAADPSAPPMDMQLGKYDFSVGRIVINDLMLRPYELKLATLAPENEFAEVLPFLQTYAAVSRTFAADTYAMFDLKAQMDMTQMGERVAINFALGTYGARGMRGSDLDAAFMRGMTFEVATQAGATSPAGGPTMPSINVSGGVELISMQETRLDKLTGYLARGEWPPRTETDLLSYGLITAKNETFAMNGQTLYSIGEMAIDARKWHWFVPTKASFKATDIVYDIAAFSNAVSGIAASVQEINANSETPAAPAAMIPPEIMQALTKYGLDKPSIDFALGWDWNPTSGATVLDAGFGLDNYFTGQMKYEGGMPTFKGVSDLIPDKVEETDGDAIGVLFAKASTLKLVDISIVDNGGLEKSFGLAAEIAALQPGEPGAPNPMANMTPEAMRSMATAGAYMLADQAAAEVPTLKPLITPLAAFVEKGGRVKITLAPKAPVEIATLVDGMTTGQITPDAALAQLNAKVEHMPPAGK